jgi:cell division protein FtsW
MKRKRTSKPKLSLFAKGSPDRWVLGLALALSAFGLLMVYNASTIEAFRDFGDPYYYVKNQAVWLGIGWLGLLLASFLDYRVLKTLALPLFAFNILLLLLVLVPGIGVEIKGARRWLELGPVMFQPTEILKTSLVLYLAVWLEEKRNLVSFLALIGVVLALVMAQPDLGTAVVIVGSAFLVYYLSGAPVFRLLLISLLLGAVGFGLIWLSPYRQARLLTFLDPTADPLGSSYHVRQVLLSLGSGGLTGVGLGQSRQKYQYLPEATTDSIFAVVAEEIGFAGAIVMIAGFVILVYRGLLVAGRSDDPFGQLLAAGITAWVAVQTLVNLAAMVALVPLTGIPLPLISYGGSSLVVTLVSLGVLISVSRYNRHKFTNN